MIRDLRQPSQFRLIAYMTAGIIIPVGGVLLGIVMLALDSAWSSRERAVAVLLPFASAATGFAIVALNSPQMQQSSIAVLGLQVSGPAAAWQIAAMLWVGSPLGAGLWLAHRARSKNQSRSAARAIE